MTQLGVDKKNSQFSHTVLCMQKCQITYNQLYKCDRK